MLFMLLLVFYELVIIFLLLSLLLMLLLQLLLLFEVGNHDVLLLSWLVPWCCSFSIKRCCCYCCCCKPSRFAAHRFASPWDHQTGPWSKTQILVTYYALSYLVLRIWIHKSPIRKRVCNSEKRIDIRSIILQFITSVNVAFFVVKNLGLTLFMQLSTM